MTSRVAYISAWVVLVATFAGSALVFPHLPPEVAMHWNAVGEVNGTANSFWGAFLLPLVMLVFLLLFTAIPHIDPLRENFVGFRSEYSTFIALIMLVLAIAHGSILAWNLGVAFDIKMVVLPASGILVFYIGVILPKTKRNWFVGIRTPWTISSDIVWKKTHELGARLFMVLGILMVFSTLAPGYAIAIFVIPLAAIVFGLIAYSYVIYRGLEDPRT
jgi:uncharacterized membrane protein